MRVPIRTASIEWNLTLQGADGTRSSYFFATAAPGLIAAQSVVKGEDGNAARCSRTANPSILAADVRGLPRGSTHSLELCRAAFVGRSASTAAARAEPALRPTANPEGGRLFFTTAGLDALLATFIRDGTRATVIDANALKLGSAGTLTETPLGETEDIGSHVVSVSFWVSTPPPCRGLCPPPDHLSGDSVSAALYGHPHAQWVLVPAARELLLTAAAPIVIDGHTRGAVVLEQAADQLLALRDRALTRLFNLTLIATAAEVIDHVRLLPPGSACALDDCADAADSAVGSDGKIQLRMPESASGDEIGALSRGFETAAWQRSTNTRNTCAPWAANCPTSCARR